VKANWITRNQKQKKLFCHSFLKSTSLTLTMNAEVNIVEISALESLLHQYQQGTGLAVSFVSKKGLRIIETKTFLLL